MSRFIFTSDTHEHLPYVPNNLKVDAVIFCGDIANGWGGTDIAREIGFWKNKFKPYAQDMRDRGIKLIGIPGNHDFWLDKRLMKLYGIKDGWDEVSSMFDLLVTSGRHTILGYDFLFFCYCKLQDFAFYMPNNRQDLILKQFQKQPDFLVTHTPPYDIMSVRPEWGSYAIRDNSVRLQPKLGHVFGHCHTGRGYQWLHNIEFYNVAYCANKNTIFGSYMLYDTTMFELTKELTKQSTQLYPMGIDDGIQCYEWTGNKACPVKNPPIEEYYSYDNGDKND